MNAHMTVAPEPLQYALGYAARGWPVFPCNPLTKTPLTENGHKDATTDPATIRRWWRESPNAMIGCPTGPRSGFWALDIDVDPTEGKNGAATLEKMGVLPDTVEQTTPRGGQHKFFRWDSTKPIRNTASKLGPDIDTRGDGGYVILAGSVRAGGGRYEWAISPENGKIAEAPEWLYEAYRTARGRTEQVGEIGGEFPFDVAPITAEAARVLKEQCLRVAATKTGSRNNALNEAAYLIGLKVGVGEISAGRAREGLMWAATACDLVEDDGEDAARKTIASGLTSGAETASQSMPSHWHEPITGRESETGAATWSHPATVFSGKAVPAQRWLVGEMIPARTVTLLYGDGGTGKSLISLQLAFGVAATGKWLDRDVTRGTALFVTAEDEDEEIHRRLAAVVTGSGFALDQLGDLHWRSLAGQDAVLAAPKGATGLMEATGVMKALWAEVKRLRPVLLVLDTLADLFGGDEVKRIQARQFIQMLQGLIVRADWDLTIVLLAHPSVAGMNSGTGTSGSTAWSNSVRSRLYLERRLVRRDKDAPPVEIDPDIRILSTKKANRTKQGGEITVRWTNGKFIAQTTVAPSRDPDLDALDEKTFLDLLDEFTRTGRHVSPNKSSPTYAPRLFMSNPIGEEIGVARMEGAMSRLFSQNSIGVERYGPPAKNYTRIARPTIDLFG